MIFFFAGNIGLFVTLCFSDYDVFIEGHDPVSCVESIFHYSKKDRCKVNHRLLYFCYIFCILVIYMYFDIDSLSGKDTNVYSMRRKCPLTGSTEDSLNMKEDYMLILNM